MKHNAKNTTEPPAPVSEQKPPTKEEARSEESGGSTVGRIRRLEYKLDHISEALTTRFDEIAKAVEDIPEPAEGAAPSGAVLIDPDQMRMLLKEETVPIRDMLKQLRVQQTDILKRLNDLEASGTKPKRAKSHREPPDEVRTHPFYPAFKRLGERLAAMIEAKGWTQIRATEEFNASERTRFYSVKIGHSSVMSTLVHAEFSRDPKSGRYHPGVSMIKYRSLDEWLTSEGF